MLAQNIVNGLMDGWIYILVGLGLTLVLSIVGIVQLAHGEIYMVGAYVAYYFCVNLGLNFYLSLIISIIVMGIFGIILERFVLRPFQGNMDGAIIATVGLILILQTVVIAIAGTTDKGIPNPTEGVLVFFGLRLSWQRLITMVISIVLVCLLLIFIKRTKIGQAMLAVSEDREAATLQGISINRVSAIAMFLGCALAAAAGALVGSIFNLTPFMGSFALIKGISVIILGGLGSIPGTIVGGLILGLIDGLVGPVLSVQWADIIGLLMIVGILLFRPKGIWGHD